ncbi:MAG: 3-deoxy-manno-octulosonate cytidylyltransferase [Candidatus Scalindua sp.]|jgi:3-deoxy-manno-octulosonate cytidylyltransferase (CMP-KDO synthetase)|nr:3-deoxy-manno-octulosonate cytidylyltransferase [Candidatus Scalindua sp.]
MNVIGVIPARMGSTRFPGKPLKKIHGMPMVGHCYHRTAMAPGIDKAYVATCDSEIYDYILSIGGNAVMTADTHTRATTRTAEALEKIEKQTGQKVDVVVMVQGDEPLIHPDTIGETIPHFQDKSVDIVNIMSRLDTKESFEDKNNVKVVVNNNSDALYYSREPVPSPWNGWEDLPRYMQTGIIAFRRETLIAFNAMPETRLEQIESVDMNRVLETGGRIRMVLTDATTIGVDVPEELAAAEVMLNGDDILERYIQS